MCRFVAFLGKEPVILSDIIAAPENSLIRQSLEARLGHIALNADGFGIAWYDHSIDHAPGIFKSIQPAWNDFNLRHLASKVRSTCFLGHVRASTVGDVNTYNCHPFNDQQFSFVHNGTIEGFQKIKRELRRILDDVEFELLRGQTDSEHFFALLMDILHHGYETFTLDAQFEAYQKALKQIEVLTADVNVEESSRLNTVLTDGKQLLASRYVSDPSEVAWSLYYQTKVDNNNEPISIIVASEPLTETEEGWQKIPTNHALLVDESLNVSLRAL